MNTLLGGFIVPPRPPQPRQPGAAVTRLQLAGEITVEAAIPLFHEIEASRDHSIEIDINSRGGNALCSFALFELLANHPHRVIANIFQASSGAATVAMAGDTRRIARSGCILIHRTRATLQGATAEMVRSLLADLEYADAISAEIFTAATGRALEEVAAWRRKDATFDARDAIAAGLAHEFV